MAIMQADLAICVGWQPQLKSPQSAYCYRSLGRWRSAVNDDAFVLLGLIGNATLTSVYYKYFDTGDEGSDPAAQMHVACGVPCAVTRAHLL